MENDLVERQAAIDALDVLCQEHRYKIPGKIETYSQYNEAWQDALDRAENAIGNLPSAQPDLDSAYTEGYTQAEAKYRKMWDEMQATQPVPEDKWDLFEMISSVWYGKQCYFEQNDGTVYSRLTGRYLTFEDAVKEFMVGLKNG